MTTPTEREVLYSLEYVDKYPPGEQADLDKHRFYLDRYTSEALHSYIDYLTERKLDLEQQIAVAQGLIDHREAAPQEYLWEGKLT